MRRAASRCCSAATNRSRQRSKACVEALERPRRRRPSANASRPGIPGRELRREVVARAGRERDGSAAWPRRRRAAAPSRCVTSGRSGPLRIVEDEQLGDRRVERLLGAGEPDGLKRWLSTRSRFARSRSGGAHLAVDHRLRVAEEVLVVRALRRAVGENERRLAAAAGATAALRVVGRRRRDVAQVDGVQRRDVDAELHRRRAEEHRQEAVGLAELAEVLLVGGQLLALLARRTGSASRGPRASRRRPGRCAPAPRTRRAGGPGSRRACGEVRRRGRGRRRSRSAARARSPGVALRKRTQASFEPPAQLIAERRDSPRRRVRARAAASEARRPARRTPSP